jgi:hypothetical protein
MDSESKIPTDGSELMIDTTFDSSAPLANDRNHGSSSRHRWIPSMRKLMKHKSADSSVRVQSFVMHSPEVIHQQIHFHVASLSGPPSILKHPDSFMHAHIHSIQYLSAIST